MNKSTTLGYSRSSLSLIFLICLLCVSIGIQMLGTPSSFIDLNENEAKDLVKNSLLEGLSLPTEGPISFVASYRRFSFLSQSRTLDILLPNSLFRPPKSHA